MLTVAYGPDFLKAVSKIKDSIIKEHVKKQIKKILENPEVGKPMRYDRRGTREVYVKPLRLSYAYIKRENKVVFLELYTKDKQ